MQVQIEPSKKVLTPEQVAQYLQLNRETIYDYIKNGELAAVKIGRYYRVPQESLIKFMLAHSTSVKLENALNRRFLSLAKQNKAIPEQEIEEDINKAIYQVRKLS